RYTLVCFGGAAGQLACLVAEALGVGTVLVHPLASVLSAYGIGLAETRVIRARPIERALSTELERELEHAFEELGAAGRQALGDQGITSRIGERRSLHVRYQGTDSPLVIDFQGAAAARASFEERHRALFGFVMPEVDLIVESISVEAIGEGLRRDEPVLSPRPEGTQLRPVDGQAVDIAGKSQLAPVFERSDLCPGDQVPGPALIADETTTIVVEPGWQATMNRHGHLILENVAPVQRHVADGTLDPIMLEIFNNLFMSVAEQMGGVLQNTAMSVNIKERLDFSCAVFDCDGRLIANAPHIPVHLGSMGASVQAILRRRGDTLRLGDSYAMNDPYDGGTHLPDVTVITPVFDRAGQRRLFFVASRGHHADIGGMTPGSMPPHSHTIHDEGVLLRDFALVSRGRFRERELRDVLVNHRWPARNPDQNVADLKAQVAANTKGVDELLKTVDQFGLETVMAYMDHVRANARMAVQRAIERIRPGRFELELDSGALVRVVVQPDASQGTCV
ncbi:MAG: hydantoinase B/oxoprolinase family protein, partial [Chloroflexota bacterium]|nr:hydantoinase B/oxoprolinase family protein [Chloroflexota bacterium]